MRIQILSLPHEVLVTSTPDRPVEQPFALLVDQCDPASDLFGDWPQFASDCGARAIICVPQTMDVVETLTTGLCSDPHPSEVEVVRLADFLLANFDAELGGGGPVDTAIRLLSRPGRLARLDTGSDADPVPAPVDPQIRRLADFLLEHYPRHAVGTYDVGPALKILQELTRAVDTVRKLHDAQAEQRLWDASPYECGLYNGLELALAALEDGRPPAYRKPPVTGQDDPALPERIAKAFHATYERLAPEHGSQPRTASEASWDDVPENNRALMIAVAADLLAAGVIARG